MIDTNCIACVWDALHQPDDGYDTPTEEIGGQHYENMMRTMMRNFYPPESKGMTLKQWELYFEEEFEYWMDKQWTRLENTGRPERLHKTKYFSHPDPSKRYIWVYNHADGENYLCEIDNENPTGTIDCPHTEKTLLQIRYKRILDDAQTASNPTKKQKK